MVIFYQNSSFPFLSRLEKNPSKLHDKLRVDSEINWWTETEKIMRRFSLDPDTLRHNKNKRAIIKEKISESFKKQIIHTMIDKSKVRYHFSNNRGELFSRKPYLKKLTRYQASIIFKARCRMIEVKSNYKGSYNDLTCRLCGQQEETQDHILTECTENKIEDQSKISIDDIFNDNDLSILKRAGDIIRKTIELVEETSTPVTNGNRNLAIQASANHR